MLWSDALYWTIQTIPSLFLFSLGTQTQSPLDVEESYKQNTDLDSFHCEVFDKHSMQLEFVSGTGTPMKAKNDTQFGVSNLTQCSRQWWAHKVLYGNLMGYEWEDAPWNANAPAAGTTVLVNVCFAALCTMHLATRWRCECRGLKDARDEWAGSDHKHLRINQRNMK